VQRHPVSRDIVHVDFQMIEADKPVDVELPLRLVGTPKGVKLGGILEHITREIEVRCLPRHILSSFDVNVEDLDVGDSISVEDIQTPNMEILTEQDRTIAACVAPTILAEPTTTEEEETPEGAAEGAEAGDEKEGDGDKSE
jgi:large subunit ribosomal protein L25